MAAMILECPHCGAEKTGFQFITQIEQIPPPARGYAMFRTVLACAGCREMVVGIFLKQPGAASPFGSPAEVNGDPRDFNWQLVRTYPAPVPSRCPEHTPDHINRVFVQAANAQKRGDADASGAMSRKVVDISTQSLLGERSKNYKNIYQRIEALASDGTLTPDLKEWAHEIRLGGADAAHDLDPFTQEEADEQLAFAELYLIYVYSLPERLRLRRERAAVEKEKSKCDGSN